MFDNMTNKKTQVILICVCVAVALALIAGAAWGYFTFIADDGLILNNVYIDDVNISGKTPEEAKTLVERQTDLTYPYEDMVIRFPDQDLRLSPADTGVSLDIDKMIEDAYNYGRTGTWQENYATREAAAYNYFRLELGDYLTLNTDYVQAQLDAYEQAHSSEYADATVTVEGERPALDAENYKEENPCQIIKVYTGNPGRTINMEGIFERIIEAYDNNEFLVVVDVVPEEKLPGAIDLEPLVAEHCTEAVDAAFTKNGSNITLTPETWGYTFDLEAAKALLAEAEYDQTIEIPFTYVKPATLASELQNQQTESGSNQGSGNQGSTGEFFGDVLGKYTTYFSTEPNRTTNIKLAAKAINGTVLMPGEKFSYNSVVGPRTAERGYKPAPAYVGGKTVDELGGGICQVSSTLYMATLLADMKINTRHAHGYVSSYMPLGMDATVSWGGPHFVFSNNTKYPIKIVASVSGGSLTVKILGTDTKSYYVKMEYEVVSTTESKVEYKEMTSAEAKKEGYRDGQVIQSAYTGKKVITYRCKYDDKTGKLISRDYEATSNYKARNKIIVKIVSSTTKPTDPPATSKPTNPPTTPPTNPPTQPPTEAPTAPPTEAPTEAPTESQNIEEPTEAATQAPTEAPTDAPTEPAVEGISEGE